MIRAVLLIPTLLIEALFFLLGLVLVPVTAALGAYRYRVSDRFADRWVLSWTWSWMWPWGNEEDGIDGLPLDRDTMRAFRNSFWLQKTMKWSQRRRTIAWAALRNSASNLRYIRGWGLLIDPRKIFVHFNNGTSWFVSHGWRSTYWYQGRRWRFWIGWNLKPWDYSPFATALPEGDPRSKGVGFKLQFKRAR